VLDGVALRSLIEAEKPNRIVPEVKAVAMPCVVIIV